MFKFDFNKLKCSNCEQIYTKPMMLPCKNSLCSYCITAIILEQPENYECIFCHQVHILSEENLTIDDSINQELNQLFEDFNSSLNNLESVLNKLEFNLNNRDKKIKEYCIQLKQKVQYVTAYKIQHLTENQSIDQLIDSNEQMLNQIDQFEKEKLEKYVKSSRFETMLVKAKKFCSQWKDLKPNDFILNFDLINFVWDLQCKLEVENENLNSLMFGNQILKLVDKDLVKCSMDTIDYNNLRKIDFKKQLNKIKKLYEKNFHLIDTFKFRYSGSGFLSNDNIVLALVMTISFKDLNEKDYNLCLVQFDKNKSLVRYKIVNNVIDSNLIVYSDKCVIDCSMFESHKECIKVFDKNFNLLNEFKTRNQSLIAANDSYIVCVNKNILKEPLVFYNWSFQILKTIGQRVDLNNQFYFSNTISYFESKYGKYYVVEEDKEKKKRIFKIFDEFNGILLAQIDLERDSEVNICTNINKLFIYDLKNLFLLNPSGLVLKKLELINFPLKSILSFDNSNNLVCFDENVIF